MIFLRALVLAGLCACSAKALTCPTLPPSDAAELIFLAAASYNATPFQTLAYNGTKWGPTLRLKEGQLYQIDVFNEDVEPGTSVHWHGQRLLNASWADGVAPITQAPTPPGSTFSYRFVAEPAGTYWYHSHTSEQYGDGLRGPLIVEAANDPLASMYDADSHLLLLADVFPTTLTQQLENLEQNGMMMGDGCSYQDISDAPWYAVEVNGESFNTTGKAAVFEVQPGKKYRFRTIGGMSSWGLEVAVMGHQMTIIAVDGQPVEPLNATAFRVTPGERVDFVLSADQPVANYWINITTINGMSSPAILHYTGAPDPAADPAVSETAYTKNMTCASGMGGQPGVIDFKNATLMANPSVQPPPEKSTKQFTVYLPNPTKGGPPEAFRAAANQNSNPFGLPAAAAASLATAGCPGGVKYCWSLNWNVFSEESEGLPIYPATFQPANSTYYIPVELGDVVDIAFVNPTTMVHPMHLHGGTFWVLAAGNGDVTTPDGMFDSSKVTYNLRNPIARDNVPVPQAITVPAPTSASSDDGSAPGMAGMGRRLAAVTDMGSTASSSPTMNGYTVVRFVADNPGVWSFHCHIDLHAVSGMFLYLQVSPAEGEWYAPDNLECV